MSSASESAKLWQTESSLKTVIVAQQTSSMSLGIEQCLCSKSPLTVSGGAVKSFVNDTARLVAGRQRQLGRGTY